VSTFIKFPRPFPKPDILLFLLLTSLGITNLSHLTYMTIYQFTTLNYLTIYLAFEALITSLASLVYTSAPLDFGSYTIIGSP